MKVEGIVLKSAKQKDRDATITLMTSDYGIISLYVKNLSSRNTQKILLATPFTRAHYLLRKGRSDLYTLLEGQVLEDNALLRSSYATLQIAGQMASALLSSQMRGKPSPALYALLKAYLHYLPLSKKPNLIYASFLVKILCHEGILSLESPPPSLSPESWEGIKQLAKARQFAQIDSSSLPPEIEGDATSLTRSLLG